MTNVNLQNKIMELTGVNGRLYELNREYQAIKNAAKEYAKEVYSTLDLKSVKFKNAPMVKIQGETDYIEMYLHTESNLSSTAFKEYHASFSFPNSSPLSAYQKQEDTCTLKFGTIVDGKKVPTKGTRNPALKYTFDDLKAKIDGFRGLQSQVHALEARKAELTNELKALGEKVLMGETVYVELKAGVRNVIDWDAVAVDFDVDQFNKETSSFRVIDQDFVRGINTPNAHHMTKSKVAAVPSSYNAK